MNNQFNYSSRQAGLTLVEILVAITIGLMVMAGVVQLYATSSKTQQVQEGASRLQENARFIFARLSQDISQTGFIGCLNMDEHTDDDVDVQVYLTQDAGPGEVFNFEESLSATEGDQLLGTDSLVVRHASTAGRVPLVARSESTQSIWVDENHGNYASLEQHQVVMVANCGLARIFMITNDPETSNGEIQHAVGVVSPEGQSNNNDSLEGRFGYTQLDANNRQYEYGGTVAYLYPAGGTAQVYAVGTSAAAAGGGVCSVANPELCSLFINQNEIAQGVEDFQIQVGWLDNAGNIRITNAAGVPEWGDVDRIQVTMTLNSINQVPNEQGGGLDRQTFSKTFMVRNQLR
ncbi:PilW family protein [Maricurvus nonylphenolicus]|uniref:PilW family protein n=1 Tax=Maricurvus nonylphenolicus TaxID=1008307 RepID=UPI0036F2D526